MKKFISAILIGTACLASCNIERLPTDSLSAKQITENPQGMLDGLMNGVYAQLKTWSDPMHRCGEYAGDNMMIRGASTDAFYEFISFSRTPNNYRLQAFWDYGYKAIAQASNIIHMIPEGTDAKVNNSLGECYFVRGMMYFYLCRAYGRPYYQAPDKNLGVPIVNGTPEDMDNLTLPDRATVKETYEQAISDLKKAESLLTFDKGPAYASKGAAQALLSRVYLYMSGTYENPNREYAQLAVDYANKVIESGHYQLLPREEFMMYNTIVPDRSSDNGTESNNPESIFVIKRVASEYAGYDHYYGIGGMYSNIGGMGWGEMYASAKYLDLLNETGQNDWRPGHKKIVDARANFIEPQYKQDANGNYTRVFRFIKDVYDKSGKQINFNYVQAKLIQNGAQFSCQETVNGQTSTYEMTPLSVEDSTFTIQYSDGKTYKGVIDYEMQLNRVYPMFYIVRCSREGEDSQLHSPVISRLGEIYLNRAEAYAKLGNYGAALKDLNIIRTRSLGEAKAYTALDASNAAERIDKERQLELAYQAERSYDVFRNGKPLVRRYPGPHNPMQDVPAVDFRVTYYIPQNAINNYPSGSKLTQNPTSDEGVVLH